jgi:hypothetical protein
LLNRLLRPRDLKLVVNVPREHLVRQPVLLGYLDAQVRYLPQNCFVLPYLVISR